MEEGGGGGGGAKVSPVTIKFKCRILVFLQIKIRYYSTKVILRVCIGF